MIKDISYFSEHPVTQICTYENHPLPFDFFVSGPIHFLCKRNSSRGVCASRRRKNLLQDSRGR